MKKILAVAAGIFLLVICGSAQQVTADGPAAKDDIARLFTAMHARERAQLMMEEWRKQSTVYATDFLLKQIPAMANRHEQVQAMVKESLDVIFKDYPVDAILNESIPIYQKHLTRSDVDALVSFYSTEVGQKLLREFPAIYAESSQLAYARLQPRLQLAMTELTKRLTETTDNGNRTKPKSHNPSTFSH
jgi:uncharacterized protein